VLYALVLVEKPQGFPYHFAGVVATGVNLLPDHRFEFWSQEHVDRNISSGSIAKFDIRLQIAAVFAVQLSAAGLGPGLAIGRRDSRGV